MGGFYNINIQDCYAAAATGTLVQPGLACGLAYPGAYPYANVRVQKDEFVGHGHGHHQRHPSLLHKLLLLAGGFTIIGAMIVLGNKSAAAKEAAGAGIKTKAWWKPQTWQNRLAVWNPARVQTSIHVPGRTAHGYGPSAMWHRVDSFNRNKQVFGKGAHTGISPKSPVYPRSPGPFPLPASRWQRFRSFLNLP